MLLLIITSTFVYDHLSCSFADAVNCLDYQVMSDDPCCCHEGRRTPEYPPEFLCRKFAIPLWLDSYLNSGLAIRKINRITVLLLVSRIRQRSWIFEIHDDYSYYDGPCSTPQARSKFYPFFGNSETLTNIPGSWARTMEAVMVWCDGLSVPLTRSWIWKMIRA